MKKFLYLPIESKVRELDAKILIALEALNRDYVVILGSKSMMRYLKYLPKGILFYKDASSVMEDKFKKIKSYGHKIVVHDEEGFVQLNWSDYLRRRIMFNTINFVDLFFCWGGKQKKVLNDYKEKCNLDVDCISVGHPRIDLLRRPIRDYNKSITTHKKKTILINTKVSEANHRNGEYGWLDILKAHNMIGSEEELLFRKEQIRYKKQLMGKYIDLVKMLHVTFSDVEIILRPHPTENVSNWKNIFKDLTNVVVTNELPIGYWIQKADIVIHTGCSTALEAFIMDKPVITFKPLDDKRFDVPLPDSISLKTTNESECLTVIDNVLKNKFDFNAYKITGNQILSDNIDSLEDEFSYIKIANELDKLELNENKFNSYQNFKIKIIFMIHSIISTVLKKYIKRNVSINSNQNFSENDIKTTVSDLSAVINLKEDDISIGQLSENLYLLNKS